jgi:hemerythrin superfamily protein
MDITELLQMDHDELLRLSRRMGQQGDPQDAKALYRELRALLVAHSRAEEAVVYRALDKLGQVKLAEATQEGEVEHSLCDHLMGLMARGRAESAVWKARAAVVHELLDHHVQEEKDEMFPTLRKHFDAQARAAMGQQFERRKALLLQASGKAG